jgi:hypothetical protein
MRKRIWPALALVALVVAAIAAPSGTAAAKKTHKINATVLARSLSGNTVTGTAKSNIGNGAVVYVVTPNPDGTQHLVIKSFLTRGVLKAKGDATVTANPDGTGTFTGSGTVVGGSGLYKGATGSFKANGTIDKDGLIHATLTGHAKY